MPAFKKEGDKVVEVDPIEQTKSVEEQMAADAKRDRDLLVDALTEKLVIDERTKKPTVMATRKIERYEQVDQSMLNEAWEKSQNIMNPPPKEPEDNEDSESTKSKEID